MKVLRSWLEEYAPLDASLEELHHAFGALGTPVEDERRVGEGLDGVVVAKVLDLRPHPDADRIQLVDVDAGTGSPLQVCCGAFNMAVGDLVPLATVGTTMPGGLEIGRRKLRGQWSEGMLCSAVELGLGVDAGGILVLDSALPGGAELGTPLTEALGITADVLWDLEVNPNRPDAMSVVGVARDLAAWFKVPFQLPTVTVAETGPPVTELVTIEVRDLERCGRFTARVLRGVEIRPSNPLIATRLTLLGMRPINNVVDASNYVMLELGVPNHTYDLARLGAPGLIVRRARPDETLETLDGVLRRFTADDLVICDASDEVVGIAGIIGGSSSEISPATTDVLVEAAWWLPMPIARSSRRLGVRTEASARFERGTDPELLDLAQDRFIDVLGGAAGEVAGGIIDVRGELPARPPVRLRVARTNRILGTALDRDQIKTLLDPIGFRATPVDEDLDVVVPSWRFDSDSEIDVIEEVARHHGYERIGAVVPPAVHTGELSARQRDRRLVRDVMTGLGLAEAMPLPFLAPGDLDRTGLTAPGITITNPLVADESVLRTSLLPGLLRTVAYNESHRVAGAAFFEIGHVFRRPADPQPLPDEREHLGVIVAGAEAPVAVQLWEALAEALAVPDRALVSAEPEGFHPTRAAEVIVGDEILGHAGEVDPGVLEAWGIAERVAYFEIDLDRLLAGPHGERRYRKVSRYPSADLDLAFETPDEVPAAAVAAVLRQGGGDLLVDLELFDVYRGPGIDEGHRSLAFRLRFQAEDRTLVDAELAAARAAAIEAVEAQLPARLRGDDARE